MCEYLNILPEKFDENEKNLELLQPIIKLFPYELSDFQKHGAVSIMNDENVLCISGTGNGKSSYLTVAIYRALSKNKQIVLAFPIKSLSNQMYNNFCKLFGKDKVSLYTGDIKVCPSNADIIICTTELLRNAIYKSNDVINLENVDIVCIDEIHTLLDNERGKVYEETLILLSPNITIVGLSATISNEKTLANWLGNLKKKKINLVIKKERFIPLTYYYYNFENNNLIEFGNSKKEFFNYNVIKDSYKKISMVKLLNPFIKYLEENNLFSCLFFLFSKKKCEQYAKTINRTLVSSEESANIVKLFDKHLAPYRLLYEKCPQYNLLRSLVAKGVAFHHSSLIHVLKEVVEILIEQKMIKIVFCTTTFSVGINSNTRTCVFSNCKIFSNNKFDYISTSEWLQCAGRAGRRNIDTYGKVIILPIEELPKYDDLKEITCGNPQEISSKFYYTYQFILKMINSPNINLNNFIETSLYNIDILENIKSNQYELKELRLSYNEEDLSVEMYKQIDIYEKNQELLDNKLIKIKPKKIQAMKKENQKLKEDENFDLNLKKYQKVKARKQKIEELKDNLYYLENYNKIEINNIIDFLLKNDYITFAETHNIWNSIEKKLYMDYYNTMILTTRGLIAENINECNCILLTEIIMNKYLEQHSIEEIIGILCIFIEEKTEYDIYINDLNLPDNMNKTIKEIQKLSNKYENIEAELNINIKTNWTIYLSFVETGYMWACMKNIYEIYNICDIYEGNFIKNIIELNNICENIKNICEMIKNYDLLKKIEDTHKILIREQVTLESLYIK
jgi:superfamily II RNA helicase